MRLPNYQGCKVSIGRIPIIEGVLNERRSFIEVHEFVRDHKEGSLTTVVTDRGSDEISEQFKDFLRDSVRAQLRF